MAVLMDLFSSVTSTRILLAAPVIFVFLLAYQAISDVRYPKELPLAGEPEGRRTFSLRTRWRYYTNCAALYREAYEKYSKKGKAVLLPGLGFRRDILLPPSLMRWALSRPDTELNHPAATLELVQIKFGLGHERYKTDPWPKALVKADINASLEEVSVGVNDELAHAFGNQFGHDERSWKEVELVPAVRRIVAQVANRFTVGTTLCRKEAYNADCLEVIDGIALNGGLSGATPQALRPLLSPLYTWKLRRSIDKIKSHIRPRYEQTLRELSSNGTGGAAGGGGEFNTETKTKTKDDREPAPPTSSPPDFFRLMLQYAHKERPGELHDLDVMTRRLCFANFASMHQTSVLLTNVLLNVVASDAEFDTVRVLRDEVARVIGRRFDGSRGRWSKQQVAQLVRLDSVLRETLRLHSYSSRGVFRRVDAPGGVRLPGSTDDGNDGNDGGRKDGTEDASPLLLPRGAFASFFSQPVLCDADVHADPFKFDPFRFSRVREQQQHSSESAGANLSFVSTSPQYLVFGHGAHSCPGRFLVDFELKMMLAHVLQNYELQFPAEYGGVRPPNRWVAEACAPPAGARIMVRRRQVYD